MQDQKLRARFRSALIEPPFRTNYYDLLSTEPSKDPVGSLELKYHDRDPAKPLSQNDTREFEITIHPA